MFGRPPNLRLALLPIALVAASAPALAKPPALAPAPVNTAEPAVAAFTDSTAAGLAGTKRVAITSVIIAFQASTGGMAGPGQFFRMFQGKEEVLTVLALPDMNAALQDALAESAYKALAEELTAAGYEVVPEAQVKASANYAAILQESGYANHSRYANAMGDITLVGASGLRPYTAYTGELGPFYNPSKSYLGWVSGLSGNSTTEGGISIMKVAKVWKVPGMEAALAKELNANVVKAYYVVSLGKADARKQTEFSTGFHTGLFTYGGELYTGNYTTLDRTVTGSGKWQMVGRKLTPAKDGDVVVRLAEPIIGSTDFFNLRQGDIGRTGLFSRQQRGDINLAYFATISNEQGYGREVTGMIVAANQAMIALIKPAP